MPMRTPPTAATIMLRMSPSNAAPSAKITRYAKGGNDVVLVGSTTMTAIVAMALAKAQTATVSVRTLMPSSPAVIGRSDIARSCAPVRPAQEDLDADGQQDRGRDLDQAADGYAGPEYLHARTREQIGKVVRGAVQDPVAHRDDADRDGDRHRGAHLDARLKEVADHQQAQDHPDQRAAYDGHHRGGPGRQPEPSHAEQAHAGSEGPHGAKGQVDHAEHLVHQDDAHGERGVDSAGHQPG